VAFREVRRDSVPHAPVSGAGELRFLEEQYAPLASAMLADAPDETVAALTTGWFAGRDGAVNLLYRSMRVAGARDYVRRAGAGAVVTPEFLASSVKRCRTTGESFVLAHTHPFSSRPSFSGIDDGGEDVLMPKVRARAPTAPHGALVLGTDGGSARAWPIGAPGSRNLSLRRIGARAVAQTTPPEYGRQELALGPGSARAMGTKTVAVIGSGGLGWQIATLLWGHGVGRIVLVDHDTIEPHNRPRLPGARPAHDGAAKVAVLAELLSHTRTDGTIEPFAAPFADASARAAVAEADAIVIATDTLASRLDADRFARRVLIPVVDTGINLQVVDERLHRIGGRVSVSWPLGPCLSCMGVLTPDAVAAEVEPLGYRGAGVREEASVLAYNTVVAGLAVSELLPLLLPLRSEPRRSRYLTYDGMRAIVREVGVPGPNACGTCGDLAGAVFGMLP
jgi:molybdopterin-synthase adenylyltransferase